MNLWTRIAETATKAIATSLATKDVRIIMIHVTSTYREIETSIEHVIYRLAGTTTKDHAKELTSTTTEPSTERKEECHLFATKEDSKHIHLNVETNADTNSGLECMKDQLKRAALTTSHALHLVIKYCL